MNKQEMLKKAEAFKEYSEELESVEFLASDKEFFANVVEILHKEIKTEKNRAIRSYNRQKESIQSCFMEVFKITDNPDEMLRKNFIPEIDEISNKIIGLLKEKELRYEEAYIALEYTYKILKAMSEYTHV